MLISSNLSKPPSEKIIDGHRGYGRHSSTTSGRWFRPGAITEDDFHRHFNINVLGLLLVTQAAVKHLGEGGGIINGGTGNSPA